MTGLSRLLLAGVSGSACLGQAVPEGAPLRTADIRIRDPYIHADASRGTYLMYAQAANREGSGFTGVEAYASRDLRHWQVPQRVLVLPDDAGITSVWAPEMHVYNGRCYLLVTLTYRRTLPQIKPVDKADWPAMHVRGTHIFVADQPLGPFVPLRSGSHTPADWMALDGTLFSDQGTPYMVFCHEWVQMVDGTMDCVRLTEDLTGTVGAPSLMFRASSAPGASQAPASGKVTDGCFLYRSPRSGRLFLIWSTFVPGKGYSVVLARSDSGTMAGPWTQERLIYAQNGGHGMLFRTFEGKLLMSVHSHAKVDGRTVRIPHLFEVDDSGDKIVVGKAY